MAFSFMRSQECKNVDDSDLLRVIGLNILLCLETQDLGSSLNWPNALLGHFLFEKKGTISVMFCI